MHVSITRRTQAERRARSRGALLEAAARGLSRSGYGNLVLEQVAADAGYTRGALYHQFDGKEALALAVVEWVDRTWNEEVWEPAQAAGDPTAVLVALGRGHMVFCRRDVARVMMALRIELTARDHPVGRAVRAIEKRNAARVKALVDAGRADGSIPPGPRLALALLGALEGLAIVVAGKPDDELLAERTVRGLLGEAR
jgi:AcrR family transcriptional regulator